MSSKMETGKNIIKDLFNRERQYKIPKYQRGYAWTDKQLEDFIKDFKSNYYNLNYYYGTILLMYLEDESSNEVEVYDIVDGQQRLTTLIIFTYCLIKKLREEKDKGNISDDILEDSDLDYLYGMFIKYKGNYILTLQDQDNDFFETTILEDKSNPEPTTPSQNRLLGAKNKFIDALKDLNTDELISLKNKIRSATILIYVVSDIKEATLIFETTNDRGKNLTNLEKIKSFLMFKVCETLKNPENIMQDISKKFETIYSKYQQIEDKIKEEQILQYNYIAKEKWGNTNKPYQHYMEDLNDKVEEVIKSCQKRASESEQINDDAYEELKDFVRKYLENIKDTVTNLSIMLTKPIDEFRELEYLDCIANFYPLLLKVYENDFTEQKENYKKVCRLCEIFSFRNYVILKYRTYTYQTKWYELARSFTNSIDNINNSSFNKLFSEIKTLTLSLGSNEKFIEKLEDTNFYNDYGTKERNYFYWNYENYLRTHFTPVYNVMPFSDLLEKKNKKFKLSIEHIVAQANENKLKVIKDDSIIKYSKENESGKDIVIDEQCFNEEYLHSIGNLTLDPQSANSSKGKLDVEEKISKYFIKAPLISQLELSSFLIRNNNDSDDVWNITSIENRKEKLIEFAKNKWCYILNEIQENNDLKELLILDNKYKNDKDEDNLINEED